MIWSLSRNASTLKEPSEPETRPRKKFLIRIFLDFDFQFFERWKLWTYPIKIRLPRFCWKYINLIYLYSEFKILRKISFLSGKTALAALNLKNELGMTAITSLTTKSERCYNQPFCNENRIRMTKRRKFLILLIKIVTW